MSGDRVGSTPAPLVIYGNVDVSHQIREVQRNIYKEIESRYDSSLRKARRKDEAIPPPLDLPKTRLDEAHAGARIPPMDRIEIDHRGHVVVHLDTDRGALPSNGQNAVYGDWMDGGRSMINDNRALYYRDQLNTGLTNTPLMHRETTNPFKLPTSLSQYHVTAYENGAVTLGSSDEFRNGSKIINADFDSDGLVDQLTIFDPGTSYGQEYFGIIEYAGYNKRIARGDIELREEIYYFDVNGDGTTDEARAYFNTSNDKFVGKFAKLRR